MADSKEYGDYSGDITNRQKKRWHKTEDIANDNYTQDKYNPDMIAWITPAGHKFIMDNKKGTERLVLSHMNGTGFEVLKDGSHINRIVGNSTSYIKGGSNITVQGNADHKFAGHFRQNVDGGSHTEIKGNSTQFVGGSSASHTVGNHITSTTGTQTVASEKAVVLSAAGKDKDQAPVRISLGSDGTVYITGAKHVSVQGGENVVVKAADNLALKSAKLNIDVDGDINMKSGGKVMIGGTEIHLGANKTFLSKAQAYVPQMFTTIAGTGKPAMDPSTDIPDPHPEEAGAVKGDSTPNTAVA